MSGADLGRKRLVKASVQPARFPGDHATGMLKGR